MSRDRARALSRKGTRTITKSADDYAFTCAPYIQAALRDVRAQVAQFSLEIAEKLIRKNLSTDKAQKDLVDGYVKDIKVN